MTATRPEGRANRLGPHGSRMAANGTTCTDCGGALELGFVLDRSGGDIMPGRWIKGAPQGSRWRGTAVADKECRLVETYRCAQCGLLKSYARMLTNPPGWASR